MKNPLQPFASTSLLAIIFLVAMAVQAAPPQSKRKIDATMIGTNDLPQSVFSIPSSPQEGRDPFFPYSFHGNNHGPSKLASSGGAEALILNGISGTSEHKLAMINGRTLAEGETNEVNTVVGRVRIRCMEIKGESAVVEVIGGERRELHLRN